MFLIHIRQKQKAILNRRKTKSFFTAGFTLVEMLVVLSIFGILTFIVLVRQNRFDNSILLENLGFDIALTIREAQVAGQGVGRSGDDFDSAFGVAFNMAFPDTYTSFTDENSNGLFEAAGPQADPTLEIFTIGRKNIISRVCAGNGMVFDCTFEELSITFIRPDPDAIIKTVRAGENNTFVQAKIVIQSPHGIEKEIIVDESGQISVQNAT